MTESAHFLEEFERWKKENDFQRAEETVNEGLKKYPKDLQILSAACELAQITGKPQECLNHAKTLVEEHKQSWLGYQFASRSLLQIKQLIEAESVIKEGLEHHPDEFWLLTTAIDIYRSVEKHNESLETSRKLLKLNPQSWIGYRSVAQDLISLNKIVQAEQVITNGLEQFPDEFWIIATAIDVLRRLNKFSESLKLSLRLVDKHPDSWAGYQNSAQDYLKLNQYADANKFADRGLDHFPNEISLRITSSEISRSLNDIEMSLKHNTNIIDHHPSQDTGYCRAAEDLIKLNRLDEAERIVSEGINQASASSLLYFILSSVYRKHKDLEKSLGQNIKGISLDPSLETGYARAAEDLLDLTRLDEAEDYATDGLKKNPDSSQLLILLSTICRGRQDFEKSLMFNLKIVALHPHFEAGYLRVTEDLIQLGRLEDAEKSVNQGLAKIPHSSQLINQLAHIYIRLDRTEECKWLLYEAIKCTTKVEEKNWYLEVLYTLDRPTSTFLVHDSNLKNDCDIVCIASDEAPYIHEFIFHHLYLGFQNIVIGVNKCADQTVEIINRISACHPQVKAINVDKIIRSFGQSGCYEYLLRNLLQLYSQSRYCLFIDIDEFWVADPFPTSVQQFINKNHPFDAFSFTWMHCFNEELFSKPFASGVVYKHNSHVKTMISRSASLRRMRIHAPIMAATTPKSRIRLGNNTNRGVREDLQGLDVLEVIEWGIERDYSPINKPNQAMIFHRHQRSMIEYSYRLFKATAEIDDKSRGFKNNRDGWMHAEDLNRNPNEQSYFLKVLPLGEIKSYHNKLEKFITESGITSLVDRARSNINDDEIKKKLQDTPAQHICEQINLLRRIFNGTPYLSMIEEIYSRAEIN